ncbi:MAG: L,D-transpeptidase family protein [Paracoccaceae bacterium]
MFARALPLFLLATPAAALTVEDVRSAGYDGGALPDGQSGITFAVQVALDRAGISPGIIDGYKGGMSESAIRAFETREGFEVDGIMDRQVWQALDASAPLADYTVTEADAAGLVDEIPEDYAEMAQMSALAFTSVAERLAERFHMDEDVLRALNDGSGFAPGDTIVVAAPGGQLEGTVARIEVSKADSRARAFGEDGAMLTSYPVTVGSDETPSPTGTHRIEAVAIDPTYTYDPDVNFQQGDNDEVLILPAGPNGPVGTVWLDLTEPTYGLHGTPEPSSLFQASSHGCVRFTNWDIEELASLVSAGVTVAFVE